MKIKTSELTGPALDWAVAKIENPEWWELYTDMDTEYGLDMDSGETYAPSTDWAQGGSIIERENIALRKWLECGWEADKWNFKFAEGSVCGPTPLIAAMRCFCASKLGEEVEVPDELA